MNDLIDILTRRIAELERASAGLANDPDPAQQRRRAEAHGAMTELANVIRLIHQRLEAK